MVTSTTTKQVYFGFSVASAVVGAVAGHRGSGAAVARHRRVPRRRRQHVLEPLVVGLGTAAAAAEAMMDARRRVPERKGVERGEIVEAEAHVTTLDLVRELGERSKKKRACGESVPVPSRVSAGPKQHQRVKKLCCRPNLRSLASKGIPQVALNYNNLLSSVEIFSIAHKIRKSSLCRARKDRVKVLSSLLHAVYKKQIET